MAEQRGREGGFPEHQGTGQSTHSTTGDGHPTRPGEEEYDTGRSQEGMAGQGTGQIGGPGREGK